MPKELAQDTSMRHSNDGHALGCVPTSFLQTFYDALPHLIHGLASCHGPGGSLRGNSRRAPLAEDPPIIRVAQSCLILKKAFNHSKVPFIQP
eukprot:CAMPEP_0172751480 /NCGR_PEP_ID=MMETSP1074-20121228/151765_1 /TAXON_ID=2916 /ORGANISM="Ceratium fusus, Strain PA161109" /LENGTH=91 /DNA_ID=CAMNT_0013583797 /DNA_START=237 /DNA_END=512 /DNA_ORIENTATION=+